MRFLVPVNTPIGDGSQTIHAVETGSTNARTNKRKLRVYFIAQGVPSKDVKVVMKAMGFWGTRLGATVSRNYKEQLTADFCEYADENNDRS